MQEVRAELSKIKKLLNICNAYFAVFVWTTLRLVLLRVSELRSGKGTCGVRVNPGVGGLHVHLC